MNLLQQLSLYNPIWQLLEDQPEKARKSVSFTKQKLEGPKNERRRTPKLSCIRPPIPGGPGSPKAQPSPIEVKLNHSRLQRHLRRKNPGTKRGRKGHFSLTSQQHINQDSSESRKNRSPKCNKELYFMRQSLLGGRVTFKAPRVSFFPNNPKKKEWSFPHCSSFCWSHPHHPGQIKSSHWILRNPRTVKPRKNWSP